MLLTTQIDCHCCMCGAALDISSSDIITRPGTNPVVQLAIEPCRSCKKRKKQHDNNSN